MMPIGLCHSRIVVQSCILRNTYGNSQFQRSIYIFQLYFEATLNAFRVAKFTSWLTNYMLLENLNFLSDKCGDKYLATPQQMISFQPWCQWALSPADAFHISANYTNYISTSLLNFRHHWPNNVLILSRGNFTHVLWVSLLCCWEHPLHSIRLGG